MDQFITPMKIQTSIVSNENTQVNASKKVGIPFGDVLGAAIQNTKDLQAIAQEDTKRLLAGEVDDLHTIMLNGEKASAALELTTQVTSRVVGAYNEIMKMQF